MKCRHTTGPYLNSPRDVWYHVEWGIRFALRQSGDLAEIGVAHGHSSSIILDILEEQDASDRTLHLFDTFEGYPKNAFTDDERERVDFAPKHYAVALDAVRERLQPHANYEIHKGTLAETFPTVPEHQQFCFMFIDLNLDYPTRHAISFADLHLVPGGVLIIHDYDVAKYAGVTRAVDRCLDTERYHVMVPIKPGVAPEDYSRIPAIVIGIKLY